MRPNRIVRKLGNRILGFRSLLNPDRRSRLMVSAHRLSDEMFLSMFDIPRVREHLEKRDIRGARSSLVRYFEERKSPEWPRFPARITSAHVLETDALLERAQNLLANRFTLGGHGTISFKNNIDWSYNPTADPRARWTRELHRHRWLATLAAAYERTADESYSAKCIAVINDWIARNPVPRKKNEGDVAWTLMGAGIRCQIWPTVYGILSRSEKFPEGDRVRMLRSIYDHARYLCLFHTSKNHLLVESNGLLNISLLFPEIEESAWWRETALERLDEALGNQVNRDGTHLEMCTAYQWMVTDEFQATFDLLNRFGLELPNICIGERLGKMYGVLACLTRPDGTLPQLGDGFMESREEQLERIRDAGSRFTDAALTYIGSSGESGTAPSPASMNFPDAGLYVMRSDWDRNSRYLLFDSGPYGGPHGHEDKLGIEVYAFGQAFLVDPGTYTYNKTDPYRAFFMSTRAHNTVAVSGMSQIRRWDRKNMVPEVNLVDEVAWVSEDRFDFAEGSYSDGYARYSLDRPRNPSVIQDVVHSRQIIFVKGDYWILIDRVQSATAHAYELLFHAHPDVNVTLNESSGMAELRSDSNDSALYLVPAEAGACSARAVKGEESAIQGWYCDGRPGQKMPSAAIVYETPATKNAVIATLLYPVRNVQQPSIRFRYESLGREEGLGFEVSALHGTDHIVYSRNDTLKTFGKFSTSANIACFRCDADGGVTDSWEWSGRFTTRVE